MNMAACRLFANLERKTSSTSGDEREGAFVLQRVSVLVQRYNAVLLHDNSVLATINITIFAHA